jgi:hypothetical protein
MKSIELNFSPSYFMEFLSDCRKKEKLESKITEEISFEEIESGSLEKPEEFFLDSEKETSQEEKINSQIFHKYRNRVGETLVRGYSNLKCQMDYTFELVSIFEELKTEDRILKYLREHEYFCGGGETNPVEPDLNMAESFNHSVIESSHDLPCLNRKINLQAAGFA